MKKRKILASLNSDEQLLLLNNSLLDDSIQTNESNALLSYDLPRVEITSNDFLSLKEFENGKIVNVIPVNIVDEKLFQKFILM